MWRLVIAALFIVFVPGLPRAQVDAPPSVEIAGSRLVLNGKGMRELLFTNLYSAALYLKQRTSDVGRIRDPGTPKSFRVQIVYDGSKPDKIPESWRDELFPSVSEAKEEKLRKVYSSLGQGDVILIAYTPDRGTELRLDGRSVLTDQGHGLMDVFINQWLSESSVSDELRRALLGL